MLPHGIMFHHFHDDGHPQGQGSISARQLADLIEFLGPQRILPAHEWLDRARAGQLADGNLCLTFDDNLRSQYDIAGPVLRNFGLTVFWFVYTSVLQGALERLELYRRFRITAFEHTDDFYAVFIQAVEQSDYGPEARTLLAAFDPETYLAEFPFYSETDRRFRYVRDEVLGPERYVAVMDRLITSRGLRLRSLADNLWMDDDCLRRLHDAGHIIGLHSHTHPTRLAKLDADAQKREYRANHEHLTQLFGEQPACMSHPCNSYNDDTLRVLRELGIVLGFRANMTQRGHSPLELPRQDHANILAEMCV